MATGPLDGWLARLTLSGRLDRRAIDGNLVELLIAGDPLPPTLTIDRIARDVAQMFGIRLRDLRSGTRRQSVAEPRHLAIYLARELTGLSLQRIGTYFSGRLDPATIAVLDARRLRREDRGETPL